MDLPPEHGPQAPPVPSQESPQQALGAPAESTAPIQQGYRRCSRKDGYVREDGLDKKIEGCLKVGTGHQMLISRPGHNGLLIYQKVAASTFGKGFAASYFKRPDAKSITTGAIKELEGKEFEDMMIAGVASDRRDPKKEPVDGWSRQPRTIVVVGFGNNPTRFAWYTRSALGTKFGQALVDEEIDGYRTDSGEHDSLQGTVDAVDSDSPRQARTRPVTAGATDVESNTAQGPIMARLQALEILMKRFMEK